ncbi:MAG: hypothetical protein R3E44_09075 [Paracoccaceae bacterium]
MPAKKRLIDQAEAEPTEVLVPAARSGNRVVTAEDLDADRAFVASLDDAADALGAVEPDEPEATAPEEPEADAQQSSRGSVTALVKALLADPGLSYEAIVLRVKVEHPTAQTTARSVASTASVMRKKGVTVPMRRPSAGPSTV